jgi:hypothetical protein
MVKRRLSGVCFLEKGCVVRFIFMSILAVGFFVLSTGNGDGKILGGFQGGFAASRTSVLMRSGGFPGD